MTETRQGHQDTAASAGERGAAAGADQGLIDRYLSNRLSAAELELVETRIVRDPAFRNEVELTEALRDGLSQLRDRGEIAALLAYRSWSWARPSIALAASVVAGMLGVTSFLLYERLNQSRQALTAVSTDLAAATPTHAARAETLRFERTRSGTVAPDLSWHHASTPTLLELRFDVGLEPAAGYRVLIQWLAADGRPSVLMAASSAIGADGQVAVSIHSALLRPGNYRILLEPQPSASLQQEPIVYMLRVVG